MVDFFFWLMPLLPSESQRPDEQLSLVWTMAYALVAAFAFGFFNDDVVGRWYPELNAGAQVPRPRESVRRPLALFLYVFVGLYFFSALAFLSRGAADEPFAAGRMSVAALRGGRSADGDLLRHEASALPPEQRPRGMISC